MATRWIIAGNNGQLGRALARALARPGREVVAAFDLPEVDIADPEAVAAVFAGVGDPPDFVVNAGGVICGAVEYAGGTETDAFRTIDERIRTNTTEMLDVVTREGIATRDAVTATTRRRIAEAMSVRRFH